MRYIKATLRERLLDTLKGEVRGAPSHFAVASVAVEEGRDKFKALGRIMANIRDAISKISPARGSSNQYRLTWVYRPLREDFILVIAGQHHVIERVKKYFSKPKKHGSFEVHYTGYGIRRASEVIRSVLKSTASGGTISTLAAYGGRQGV
ncbi:TPA: hypothetical protein ACGJ4G_000682 [Pseudomonas aeruginosa]